MIKRYKFNMNNYHEGPVVGQWYWLFQWHGSVWEHRDPLLRRVEFAVFKFHKEPPHDGNRFRRGEHWRGWWVSLLYWLPWSFEIKD